MRGGPVYAGVQTGLKGLLRAGRKAPSRSLKPSLSGPPDAAAAFDNRQEKGKTRMAQSIRKRAVRVALVVLAILAGATGVAYATATVVGATPAVIHACKNDTNGDLRMVGATSTCRNSESAVAWNAQGPQGDRGPTGATGPKGDAGDAGV